MNLTAELVRRWAEFEETYPVASLDDFCRYYLVSQQKKECEETFLGGVIPPGEDQTLAKLIDRISRLYRLYAESALKMVGIKSFEEFLYLNVIANVKLPKKTQVISINFSELSSGLLILDRMRKNELIEESDHQKDKRTKQLALTAKGKSVLKGCYSQLAQLNALFFKNMPAEDIKLCTQLLSPLELKFAGLWKKHKGKSFGDIL